MKGVMMKQNLTHTITIFNILIFWIICITLLIWLLVSCTNDTEKAKCEIPQDDHIYHLDAMLDNGDSDICESVNPLYGDTASWITATEVQYDNGCKIEPDKISNDNCTIDSYIKCENGIVIDQSLTWIDDNKWEGSLKLVDNNIYSCTWLFGIKDL
jgi:hypothetical protein